MKNTKTLAIVGGGAAGFFCAISAAQQAQKTNRSVRILIFENSKQVLKKVKISGGGRCNVTHNLFDVKKFVENYPRGRKELVSPFQKFQAKDTIQWFKEQGVELVAEVDGRIFPVSNSSQTIIDCYLDQIAQFDIDLQLGNGIQEILQKPGSKLELVPRYGTPFEVDAVLIATGSSPGGYKLAESLGHSITERAPSLFSFKINNPLLNDLQGISFEAQVKMTLPEGQKFREKGPLLITHWGLSGPAILKLSAWAAREMKRSNYQCELMVNWLGELSVREVESLVESLKSDFPKVAIKNKYPSTLSKRFWTQLLQVTGLDLQKQWANVSGKEIRKLVQYLTGYPLVVSGQNRYKDEFVECGGVKLSEIDFKTMQSKICPGLYFAGEILDIDGITGGFNFQNAWTTGWLAAQDMVL